MQAIRPIHEYRDIFLAMHGNEDAIERVSLEDVEAYTFCETFDEFLRMNQLPVFEKVLR